MIGLDSFRKTNIVKITITNISMSRISLLPTDCVGTIMSFCKYSDMLSLIEHDEKIGTQIDTILKLESVCLAIFSNSLDITESQLLDYDVMWRDVLMLGISNDYTNILYVVWLASTKLYKNQIKIMDINERKELLNYAIAQSDYFFVSKFDFHVNLNYITRDINEDRVRFIPLLFLSLSIKIPTRCDEIADFIDRVLQFTDNEMKSLLFSLLEWKQWIKIYPATNSCTFRVKILKKIKMTYRIFDINFNTIRPKRKSYDVKSDKLRNLSRREMLLEYLDDKVFVKLILKREPELFRDKTIIRNLAIKIQDKELIDTILETIPVYWLNNHKKDSPTVTSYLRRKKSALRRKSRKAYRNGDVKLFRDTFTKYQDYLDILPYYQSVEMLKVFHAKGMRIRFLSETKIVELLVNAPKGISLFTIFIHEDDMARTIVKKYGDVLGCNVILSSGISLQSLLYIANIRNTNPVLLTDILDAECFDSIKNAIIIKLTT